MTESFALCCSTNYTLSRFGTSCICIFRAFFNTVRCKCSACKLSVFIISSHCALNCNIFVKSHITTKSIEIKLVAIRICNSNANVSVLFTVFSINTNNCTCYDNVSIIKSCKSFFNSHFSIVIAIIVTVNSSSCTCCNLSTAIICSHRALNCDNITKGNIGC